MAKNLPTVQETFSTGTGMLTILVANFDGQLGNSTVRLDSDVKAIGSSVNIPLGLSSECKGKKVFVFTDVRDVLGATNDVSLTITIGDGSSTKTRLFPQEADGPGESVSYTIIIDLN